MTEPKNSTQRGKDRIARLKSLGMKQLRNLWAYEADEKAIRENAAKLTRKRERTPKEQ